jgi:ferric enterobactin receptor
MKIWLLIIGIGISMLSVKGQTMDSLLISANFKDASISNVFRQLGRKYDLDFAYDSKAFRNQRISIEIDSKSLDYVLLVILQPLEMNYQVVNGTIVIFPQPNSQSATDQVFPTRTNFNYTGRVVDQRDLTPLPFATVLTLNGSQSAITNEQGFFTLSQVAFDTISIQIRYLGYLARTVKLSPQFVDSKQAIELVKDNAILPLATIYGQNPTMIELGVLGEGESIDTEIIQYLPGSGEPDVVRSLQLLSGVSGSRDKASDFHVRGGASDENLVMLDGFTLYHLDHFYGVFSAFNSNSLKHVVLHKGVFDAKFGGRTSSVLELSGKQGNFVQPESNLEVGLLASSLLIESPILGKKASMMISARRSYTDVVFSPLYKSIFNGIYNSSISGAVSGQADVFGQAKSPDFSFYDVAAKLGFEIKNNAKLTFSLFSGQDQLQIQYNDITADGRFDLEYNDQSTWGNIGASGKIEKQWNNGDYAELQLSFSQYQSELFGFDRNIDLLLGVSDTVYFDRNTNLRDVSLFFSQNILRNQHKISFGTELKNFSLNSSNLQTDLMRVDSETNAIAAAFFVQDIYHPVPELLVKAGLRLTALTDVEKVLIEPRLFFEYTLNQIISLNGGVGINNQFLRRVRRQDLFQNSSDEWAFAGQDGFPILTSDHFTMGARLNLDKFTFAVSGYFANKTGVIEDVKALTGFELDAFENDLLTGTGTTKGVESTLIYSSGVHNGWISYTLGNAENSFRDQGVNTLLSSFDALHELNLVYMIKLQNWRFASTLVLASGKPFTSSPGTYTLQLLNGETQERVSFSTVNGSRLPAYQRLDFSANYEFKLGDSQVHIGGGIFNVLNHQNISNRQYFLTNSTDNGVDLAFRDLAQLGITPTIRIGISW